jgi:outer membrane receptor protein involved in Fe transport
MRKLELRLLRHFAPVKYLLLTLPAILLFSSNSLAQSGKLSGRVTDAATGEALVSANVIIAGTTMGSAADINGYYSILNIRPGKYTVNYRYIGYETKIVEDVVINADKTTQIDVALNPQAIEGQTVTVVAEKPIIEFNQTSSVKTVSSDEIETLPVQNLSDIINLQAGTVQTADGQFHMRGGRGGEIQYQVDGVSINNPYDNQSSLTLDRSIIQEVSVVTGTFDAKYGQAMSGIVNTTLKSGSSTFKVSGEVYGGDYLPLDNNTYPNNKDFLPYTLQNYQLTITGPTYIPNTTFLLSGRRYHNNGYLYGVRRFVPTDTNNVGLGIIYPTGDNKKISMDPYDEWSGQAKITNTSIDRINISYIAIMNYNWGKAYNFAYRFNPDGLRNRSTFAINHGIDLTHTLSDKMFYKLSVRHNFFDYKDYKYESLYDPRYFAAQGPKSIAGYEYGAVVQGVDLTRFIQQTNFLQAKIDYAWQANESNYIEAGIVGQINQLKFGPPGQLVTISNQADQEVLEPKLFDPNDPRFKKVETYKPNQGAAYLQDRIELGDLVVRVGLRYEIFDPQAYIPSNLQNPANTITGVPGSHLVKASIKQTLAPRLGFGFPLTDKSALHFSYGHFYQMPAYSALYQNANYQVLDFLSAGNTYTQDYLGNPDLKPELTVEYEVGLKQAINDDLGLDLTFFYKDIRDLLGTEVIETYNFGQYARNTNIDYGSVSGVTLSVTQRPSNHFGFTIDYSLQFANGNSSDPRENADRALGGQDPRPRDIPFNWDQRHTLNLTALYQVANDFNVSTIIKFASGQPYTPALVGFQTEQEHNSGRKPSYTTVDLRAEKFFDFGSFMNFSVFMRVFNLFNQDFNNGAVYADTGNPNNSLTLLYGEPIDPNRFAPPRRIEFGFSFRSN